MSLSGENLLSTIRQNMSGPPTRETERELVYASDGKVQRVSFRLLPAHDGLTLYAPGWIASRFEMFHHDIGEVPAPVRDLAQPLDESGWQFKEWTVERSVGRCVGTLAVVLWDEFMPHTLTIQLNYDPSI